jgi:hypothetical protein
MAVKQFRCTVPALTVRSQPILADQYRLAQQIKLNEVISADEDSRVEVAGFVWLRHAGGYSAERSIDGKFVYLIDTTLKPKDRIWGINIDPYNPTGNPPPARLAGLGWVRFVFHMSSKGHSLDQAFAFYDPIIRAYAQQGTSVMLILIQDTFSGNAPWINGGWDTYTQGFADTAAAIARHYRGQVAAYEIWNEGDLPPESQSIPTSIYIPPATYGPLLLAAAQAIKLADPSAKIISGGLASGDPLGYMMRVQSSIGGTLPVHGIGLHPYGLTPPDGAPFPGWSQGFLGPAIQRLADAFPRIPIWITEIGVPRVDVANRSFWPGIARYMDKLFGLIRDTYFHIVPAVIWFAWSDSMDLAGIVSNDQQPKGVIFSTFFQNTRTDKPIYARPSPTPYDGKVMLVHVAGQLVGEGNISELAQRINTSAGNVRAVLVKSGTGTSWAGQSDSKASMAINSPADLSRWAGELIKYRLDLHVWHEVVGSNINAEVAHIAQATLAPGVTSLVLDLDPARLTLRTSTAIRNFMIALRRALPATYYIGVSFDSRPETYASVLLTEWFPFINSWHPKVFHWQYSNGQLEPSSFVVATSNGLRSYPRAIVPMLQAESTGGKPVPPAHMRQAARMAFELCNAPAVSYFRLGAIRAEEFGVIQGVQVPWTAGLMAAPPSPEILVTQSTGPLRIRATPSMDAAPNGFLQPNEQITVLERSILGSMIWVRHSRGWSLSRNSATGEVFLA